MAVIRILWFGKSPKDGAAGDEVFDRQTLAALRSRGHTVDVVHAHRATRLQEIANIARGLPHYRSRYATAANKRAILETFNGHEGFICSWEPLDGFSAILPIPSIQIVHNVTSLALPQLFPGSSLAGLAAWHASIWESRRYTARRLKAIATLARRDLAYLKSLSDAPPAFLTIPGMPPIIPLEPSAPVKSEIVIEGTFDWHPKRRDLLRFAREFANLPEKPILRAGTLPPEAMSLLKPEPLPAKSDCSQAMRFGIITDRFEAGHKLKTLAYIARNQIVLSFADVRCDISDIPDHDLFVRQIFSVADIAREMAVLAQIPQRQLQARFELFRQRCSQQFTWDAVGLALAGVLASR